MEAYSEAQYVWSTPTIQSIRVKIIGAVACVPCDFDNIDYANMMALVAAGDLVIEPAP